MSKVKHTAHDHNLPTYHTFPSPKALLESSSQRTRLPDTHRKTKLHSGPARTRIASDVLVPSVESKNSRPMFVNGASFTFLIFFPFFHRSFSTNDRQVKHASTDV